MLAEWDKLIQEATTLQEKWEEQQDNGDLSDTEAYYLDHLQVFLANVGVTV